MPLCAPLIQWSHSCITLMITLSIPVWNKRVEQRPANWHRGETKCWRDWPSSWWSCGMWGRAPSLAYHLLRIIARLREQPDYVSPLNYVQTSCNGFGELSAGFYGFNCWSWIDSAKTCFSLLKLRKPKFAFLSDCNAVQSIWRHPLEKLSAQAQVLWVPANQFLLRTQVRRAAINAIVWEPAALPSVRRADCRPCSAWPQDLWQSCLTHIYIMSEKSSTTMGEKVKKIYKPIAAVSRWLKKPSEASDSSS